MFFYESNIPKKDLGGGVTRRVLAHSKNLMMVEFCFQKGSVGPMHNHVHEQVGYVRSGQFKVTIVDTTKLLKKGDSYYVHPNQMHGVVSLDKMGY